MSGRTGEAAGADVAVTACPEGPLLVRGATEVRDASGAVHPVTRPVVALCTCALTQRSPWCDGMHKARARGRKGRATGR